MAKKKIHPFALNNVLRKPEINLAPSNTVPDMSMSIEEIYRRSRTGTLPAEFVRQVLYDDDDDFDSVVSEYLPGYDLVDAQNEMIKLRQKFEAMRAAQRAAGLRPQKVNTQTPPPEAVADEQ